MGYYVKDYYEMDNDELLSVKKECEDILKAGRYNKAELLIRRNLLDKINKELEGRKWQK